MNVNGRDRWKIGTRTKR